jgi:predicted DNA-binding protein with PD1-like motif
MKTQLLHQQNGEKTFAVIFDKGDEVVAGLQDIALSQGQPKVHAHVVVGTATGTAHGGHLLEAHVWPTLEVMVVESPQYLRRTMDKETGLALIQLEATRNPQAQPTG